MARFLMVYLGGNPPSTPEEGQAHFKKYKEWLESLGDAVVSPANPLKNTHRVSAAGGVNTGSQSTMSGYTIVESDTIEAAIKMAQSCPFLEIGGTMEVSELVPMSM
ncbi:hypothetical protein FLL45_20170 [Aliikangiella marina]|uniref:YCII-related domain-containing protein n=1 Tax=Aliikangiella marina TaxID=1712262 RepID=A0A545T2N0_9GAMM|nr:YciI family protein [Aliikangiella marina]TQV71474.1 hypothetical protein FLL45_20170 [Aliikangiella marina]